MILPRALGHLLAFLRQRQTCAGWTAKKAAAAVDALSALAGWTTKLNQPMPFISPTPLALSSTFCVDRATLPPSTPETTDLLRALFQVRHKAPVHGPGQLTLGAPVPV